MTQTVKISFLIFFSIISPTLFTTDISLFTNHIHYQHFYDCNIEKSFNHANKKNIYENKEKEQRSDSIISQFIKIVWKNKKNITILFLFYTYLSYLYSFTPINTLKSIYSYGSKIGSRIWVYYMGKNKL